MDSHSVEYLGDKMREIGTMVKESICEEMKTTNKVTKCKISDVSKSYARLPRMNQFKITSAI